MFSQASILWWSGRRVRPLLHHIERVGRFGPVAAVGRPAGGAAGPPEAATYPVPRWFAPASQRACRPGRGARGGRGGGREAAASRRSWRQEAAHSV